MDNTNSKKKPFDGEGLLFAIDVIVIIWILVCRFKQYPFLISATVVCPLNHIAAIAS